MGMVGWMVIAWVAALIVLAIVEWRRDPQSHDWRVLPRCLRCDGMRDWGHRCRDAEGVAAGVDTRATSV